MKGRVKSFDHGKGFGYIEGEDGKEYLLYFTAVTGRLEDITTGALVEFDDKETNKGLQAANVSPARER